MTAASAQVVAPTLAQKVAHLSRSESYTEGTAAVETIETHMSYVFLTDAHAYKLKKPVRHPFLDFSTLEARRFDCEEELRLNRRLARDVYIAVVPLAFGPDGFKLAGEGRPVEWLVKMRRLARELMLDRAIADRQLQEEEVSRFTRVLADFYRSAVRIPLNPPAYRQRLTAALLDNHRALIAPGYALDADMLEAVLGKLLLFLKAHRALVEERAEKHMIVEGHGDLRPEHVCLEAAPVFIDCLEFNRDLRAVDPADELAYLAMECDLLGAPYIRPVLFSTYGARTGDAVDDRLISFYQAHRAILRAKLAVWHLNDGLDADTKAHWLARARRYIDVARKHCRAP